jgi:hypothetical protein
LVFWLTEVFLSAGRMPAGVVHPLTFADAISSLLFVVGFSYLPGAVPAGLVGIALGYLQIRYGRVSWYVALVCGFIGWVAYVVLWSGLREAIAFSVLICVVPTFVCWVIMRRWYGTGTQPDHRAVAVASGADQATSC